MTLTPDLQALTVDSLVEPSDRPNRIISLLFNSSLFDEKQAYQTLLRRYYQEEEADKKALASARKGGLAKKTDALSEWIQGLADDQPRLSSHRLEQLVKQAEGHGLICSVKGDIIEFYDKDGKIKEAKLSALKHRLSRAKKQSR